MRKVCPSCGAAVTEEKCPYCGIMFYDFSAIDMEKPFFMKIKFGNKIHNFKVKTQSMHYNHAYNDVVSYADNCPIFTVSNKVPELTLNFLVLSENHVLDVILDTDVTGEYGEDIISDKYLGDTTNDSIL